MAATTTLTAAFENRGLGDGLAETADERRQRIQSFYEEVMKRDRIVPVGRCGSTGKEVSICYNAFGNPADPCLLLVQGLGTPLTGWSPAFVEAFTRRGYYVVVYDNRDVGRSTRFDEYGHPSILRFALPAWASLGERCPYRLQDIMEDGIGLLNALGIRQAHIMGMSMGGFIVQLMAIHYPERVLSLNIFCSHLGGRDELKPGLATHARFIVPPRSSSPEDRARHMAWFVRFLSQGQYRTEESYDDVVDHLCAWQIRDGTACSLGNVRQIAAIMRAPSRRKALAAVTVPTLVMHGSLDPLIPVENGRRIAETVVGAKLVVFPNLGHDFPEAIQRDLAEEMLINMQRAQGPVDTPTHAVV